MAKDRLGARIPLTRSVLGKIAKIDVLKGHWHGGLRLSPQILGRLKSWVHAATGASCHKQQKQF